MKHSTKQTLLGVMTTILLGMIHVNDMNAQRNDLRYNVRLEREMQTELPKRMDSLLAGRHAKLKPLSADELFADNVDFWWDGTHGIVRGYDPSNDDEKNHRVFVPYNLSKEDILYSFTRKKTNSGFSVTLENHAGWKASVEQLGPWVLFIVRDSKGQAVDLYVKSDFDEIVNRRRLQDYDIHDVYDGLYTSDDNQKAVFGLVQKHYKEQIHHFESDPGLYFVGTDEKNGSITSYIAFGNGRVSHGDPSSPKYGQMPGGGGAGALMGPMEWHLSPIVGGLHVQIVRDQEFVSHNPRFSSNQFDLKKIMGNSAEIHGLYPVTSLRPLPIGLLRLFTSATLKVMLQEIKDRHVDGSALTDIERLNSQLIQSVLNE